MAETHVLSALRHKRAEVAGYIHDLEKKVLTWRARLAHIDETIRIFSPETDPEAIPPKRSYRRTLYFKQGEFARLLLDGLREANGTTTIVRLVDGIVSAKGLPKDSDMVLALRDRASEYLRKRAKAGTVEKTGTSRNAQWAATPSLL